MSKIATNFLTHILTNKQAKADGQAHGLTPTEIEYGIPVIINALTGQVLWSLVSYVNAQKRGETEAPPTLDERNEQDEFARGQEIVDTLSEEAGHPFKLSPYIVAAYCDGMRHTLYNMMHDGFEMKPSEEALYYEPKWTPDETRIKWHTPQSLEARIEFMTQLKGTLDKSTKQQLDLVKSRFPDQHATLLAAQQERARKQQAEFKETAAEVLLVASEMSERFDISQFEHLPLDVQLNLAEKIEQKLLVKAAMILLSRQNRTVEEKVGDSVLIEAMAQRAKAWLQQPHIVAAHALFAKQKAQYAYTV